MAHGGELDMVQGTLDMLVLKALSWGPMHGYAVLRWLRQCAGGELRIQDAALYPALHRLEARGLITSEWGLSESNRRAKYYRLSGSGRRELRERSASWTRYVSLVARVMAAAGQPA